LEVYIPAASAAFANAFEFDEWAVNNPYEYMWGSQCVVGGVWDVWDMLHLQWVPTNRACSLPAGWHHIQWNVHRIPNDTSCEGYPCLHYDMLGVDYLYTQFDMTEPAGPIPPGWQNGSGVQVQLDIGNGGQSLTEYIEHVNFYNLD
jgi:hypothetical protein